MYTDNDTLEVQASETGMRTRIIRKSKWSGTKDINLWVGSSLITLSRSQAGFLATLLKAFAETGTLPSSSPDSMAVSPSSPTPSQD